MPGEYGFPEGVTTIDIKELKNIITVNLREAVEAYRDHEIGGTLDKYDPKDVVKPLLAVGPPGIGKSQAVFQIVYEVNNAYNPEIVIEDENIKAIADILRSYGEELHVIDLRLSQLDPTDIKGLPKFTDSTVEWVLPEFLPRGGPGERFGILFLDEINLAPPSVQAACYQLILDRRVGSYELPKGWIIVSAMNPPEMAQIAYPLPPPLVNRFTILYVEPNAREWIEWAITAGIHPDIIAFISTDPDRLFEFSPTGEPYPTPRSWEYVDIYLKRYEKEKTYTEDEFEALVTGSVGKKTGRIFLMYRKIERILPVDEMVERIVRGEKVDPLEEIPPTVTVEGTEFRRIDVLSMIVISSIEIMGKHPELSAATVAKNTYNYLKYLENISKDHPVEIPPDIVRVWMILLDDMVRRFRGKR